VEADLVPFVMTTSEMPVVITDQLRASIACNREKACLKAGKVSSIQRLAIAQSKLKACKIRSDKRSNLTACDNSSDEETEMIITRVAKMRVGTALSELENAENSAMALNDISVVFRPNLETGFTGPDLHCQHGEPEFAPDFSVDQAAAALAAEDDRDCSYDPWDLSALSAPPAVVIGSKLVIGTGTSFQVGHLGVFEGNREQLGQTGDRHSIRWAAFVACAARDGLGHSAFCPGYPT
jgi:hypothetical protein